MKLHHNFALQVNSTAPVRWLHDGVAGPSFNCNESHLCRTHIPAVKRATAHRRDTALEGIDDFRHLYSVRLKRDRL